MIHKNSLLKYMKNQINDALLFLADEIPSDRQDLHKCLEHIDLALTEFCRIMIADNKRETKGDA
jgi:hypothetical protein